MCVQQQCGCDKAHNLAVSEPTSSTLAARQRLGFSAWLVPESFGHDPQNCRKLLSVGRAIARFAVGLNPGQIARYGAGLAAIPDQQVPMSA